MKVSGWAITAGLGAAAGAVAVMMMPSITVTGRAKDKNHFPPTMKLINSRYRAMAAKSQGIKITGLGFRNHRGRNSRMYPKTKLEDT